MLEAPLSDLVAAVEEEAEEEHMDEDDDLDPKDGLPLTLRALQPAGGVPSVGLHAQPEYRLAASHQQAGWWRLTGTPTLMLA